LASVVFAAGQTIAEVMTQKRPTGEATMPRLPQPFSDVARACLRMTVGAGEALRILNAAPEVVPPVKRTLKLPTAAIIAASLAVLALVYGVRSYRSKEAVPEQVQQQQPMASLPSPVSDVVRERATPTRPPAAAPSSRGDWVVVAEIYKQHDQATKRAEQIAARWKNWQPDVYPPDPRGKRFMVVLGYSETRKGAEEILARARSAGMPRNVYMTRIKR
jgi:hypothetical protein